MTKLRNIFAVFFLFVCLASVSAKDLFVGKTYVVTAYMHDGVNILPLAKGIGIDFEIKVNFKTADTCVLEMSGQEEILGNLANDSASFRYRVDKENRTIYLILEDSEEEADSFQYSEDLTRLTHADGDNEFVFLEESLANTLKNESKQEIEIDYGSVTENVFSGSSYSLSGAEFGGQDLISIFRSRNINMEMIFTSDAIVMLKYINGESATSQYSIYTIDYSKNLITFSNFVDSESYAADAVFYNKGNNIKISANINELPVTLYFTKE